MDLTKLSDADLLALQSGDLSKVSDEGLRALQGGPPAESQGGVWRQVGLTGRAGVQGIAALPGMLSDVTIRPALNLGLRLAGSNYQFPRAAQAVDQTLASAGIPTPETGTERVVGDIASAMSGVGATGRAGQVLAGSSSSMAQALGKWLTERLGSQTAAAVSGAGAGSVVREAGGGPGAQIAASLIGGAVPGVAATAAQPALNAAGRVAAPYLPGGRETVKARTLTDVTGGRKGEVLDALNSAPRELVPGSRPTAAELATPAGSTELSALQAALGKRFDPSGYADIARGQEAARLAAVRGVGGTKESLAQAIKERSAGAARDYSKAFDQGMQVDPTLARMAKNPYFKEAIADVGQLVQAKGLNPKTDLTEYLHTVKLALDDMLSRGGDKKLGTGARVEVQKVREGLVDWMRKKSPEYDAARTNFAERSKPINQQQIWQYKEQKLVDALEEGERPRAFATAMRDAPQTLKNKVGDPRYADVKEVLTPEQRESLAGVLADLSRKAEFGKQAREGSQGVREVLGQSFRPVEPPGLLNRGVTLARAVLERMQGKATEDVLRELTQDLKDPDKVAKLLASGRLQETTTMLQQARAQGRAMSAAELQFLAQVEGERK